MEIKNIEQVREFCNKIKNGNTIIFTNGNKTYIPMIKNLITSYKRFPNSDKVIGVFCSDDLAYIDAQKHSLVSCRVQIPDLEVDRAYSSQLKENYYFRLCFVKIVLIHHILSFGFDVLYIDPDMAFQFNCMDYLINLKSLTFAYCVNISKTTFFINTNIIRVFPDKNSKYIFDAKRTDLTIYEYLLPDVSDENFVRDRIHILILKEPVDVSSLSKSKFPAGGDSKNCNRDDIQMFHANCIVGYEKKMEYLKQNNIWFID
jgi:hypothetical protein